MQRLFYSFFIFIACFSCKKKMTPVEVKTVATKKMIDAYTEVQYGNMPLVISVPHGGNFGPTTIPDRTCPNITNSIDLNTLELLKAIDSVCDADYKLNPYYVFTNLKRTKIDQNREIAEATCSNPALAIYWNNYHLSLDTCINMIVAKYSQCLFIDLHGHGHTKQRLELGYLISGSELRNTSTINISSTSVFNLLQQNSLLNINQLLTGTNAFGTLMANKNFPAVPSQQDVAPLATDLFFDGGYNTQRYCSALYPKVFGWQIENNFTGVRDNKTNRDAFAKAFLQSVMQYYSANTSMEPSTFGR